LDFAALPLPELVSKPWVVLSDLPFPGSVRLQVHPSLPELLFRVPSSRYLPATFRCRSTCLGFVPHHDITNPRPHLRGLPGPRFVPSSGALSLPTFFSACSLAGLFHPAAVSRAQSRSGMSLSAQPSFLIGSSSPHAVEPHPLTRPRPAVRECGPRLRGIHPREAAFRRSDVVNRIRRSRPSSSFFSSRYSLFSPSVPAYPGLSTREVTGRCLRFRARLFRPSPASTDEKLGLFVSDPPTCSRISNLSQTISSLRSN